MSAAAAGRTIEFDPETCDLVIPYPPNWTAVWFLGILGGLHFSVAIPAFWLGNYEAYVSLILGTIFVTSSLIAWSLRSEIGILRSERRLRLRTMLCRPLMERSIPFSRVHGVRVFMNRSHGHDESQVEILCDEENIDCPPTAVPRQQALCLAMTLGVQLIKVCDDGGPEEPATTPDPVTQ